MATQLLIRHVCDGCKAAQDGDETDIRTFPLNILGDEREIDLCITCAAGVVKANLPYIEASRRPSKQAKTTKTRRRAYSGDLIPVEHDVDGKFHCPECGRVTGTSGSGLGLHMRDKHPAERNKYRIIEPPRTTAAKKAAPRKKTTPAKKATRRRRT